MKSFMRIIWSENRHFLVFWPCDQSKSIYLDTINRSDSLDMTPYDPFFRFSYFYFTYFRFEGSFMRLIWWKMAFPGWYFWPCDQPKFMVKFN